MERLPHDDLSARVERIYAALGDTVEVDLSKFPTQIIGDEQSVGVYQDFRGGLTAAQIENFAHSLIQNIASFPDHLRRRYRQRRLPEAELDERIESSLPLRLMIDLNNIDKHGPLRPGDGGRSGKAPRLGEVERVMRMSTGPQGGTVGMIMTPRGFEVVTSGGGGGMVVITGPIVDARDGTVLGNLHEIATAAIEACEAALEFAMSAADDH